MPERDRRRDEDGEDERPRRRRRDDDDEEEDDRPARNKREEDGEDERRRKSRRYADDDDDDRPRRRGREGKKTNVLLIVAIVLGVMFLCAIPVSIFLLIPAVAKVREAAGKAKDANNLKHLALSTHDYNDMHSGIDAPYAVDKMDHPNTGLSFRVGLLPFIEQLNLYNQFDLSSGWNSPRNQAASNTVVPAYSSPFNPEHGNTTPYRMFVGGGAMFNEDGSKVSFSDIKDGLGSTIMFIHAAEEVPWAKPQEIPYGPGIPVPPLGSARMPSGTNVVMADGSVHFLKKEISERTLRALITRAGKDAPGSDFP